MLFRLSFAIATCALLAACGGHGSSVPPVPSGPLSQAAGNLGAGSDSSKSKIKHVVVIVQENRSFDALFHGFAGADYANSGKNSQGQTIPLTSVSFAANYELCHGWEDARFDEDPDDSDGNTPGGDETMDGFDNPKCHISGSPPANPQYKYVSLQETTHYFSLAKDYSLGDEFFSSQLDGSYVGHQYLIASQAGWAIDTPSGFPWGCDGPNGTLVQLIDSKGQYTQKVFPCFKYGTLGQNLDAKGLSWKYYSPPSSDQGYLWTAYDAIKGVCNSMHAPCKGSEWTTHMVMPQCQILADAKAGNLPAVSWVIPDLADSDHPESLSTSGPKWVTSVVDAIGQNTALWNSTAIFVTWDDWGGFYDHAPPPNTAEAGFAPDVDGPGMRVPLIAISPYTKSGTITHKKYDGFAAIDKTIEQLDGLPSLSARDKAATSLFDDKAIFDFKGAPQPFKSVTVTGYTCNPADSRPIDSDL